MRNSSADSGASHRRPVFVDRSGRRRVLVRRFGIGAVLLGVAYGTTLIVTALVGVDLEGPSLPLVEHPLERSAPDTHPGKDSAGSSTTADPSSTPEATSFAAVPSHSPVAVPTSASAQTQPTPGQTPVAATQAPTSGSPTAGATASLTATPSATPSASPSATASATAHGPSNKPTPSNNGKSTAAPGHTKSPQP